MSARGDQRRTLRARRRALPPEQRIEASMAIAGHLFRYAVLPRFQAIAGYRAADGEADPGPFLAAIRDTGRLVHLPVLDPLRAGGMRFVRTEAGEPLTPNRFGIPEPVSGPEIRPAFLDLVLVPLVGIDARGNRLGMGAGFYDRCFAFLRARRTWRKPVLVGVAFDCQRVERIDARAWDIPLDALVTESGMHHFNEGGEE